MNNSIRKCDPTFFIPWDTVDSMFSLWTKQYFGDQVIRMHLDYDLHDNSYSFCINLKYNVKAKLFCPEIAGLFCRIAGLFCHDSRANLSLKPVCFGIAIS